MEQDSVRNLNVILWIPVRVKNDDSVSGCQVDSKTTSSRAQQEHKPVRVRLAKSIDSFLSQVATNASINPLIEIAKHKHANFFYTSVL